jgi:transmembrane 9 superfamily member 2/4
VGRGGWLQNDLLAVKVNQLSSIKTQLPYSHYSLPFCRPDTIVNSAENLGQVLRGDRIENSPYVVIPLGLQQFCNCYHLPFASCELLLLQLAGVSFVFAMQFEMMEPKLCQIACKVVLTEQGAKDIMEKIHDEYRVNM